MFHSRESALKLAFPGADSVTVVDRVLTAEQTERAAKSSGVHVTSRLVSAYRGWSGGRNLGTAYFDTHTVRTLPETILVVLDARGRTSAVHLLAFHEPPEYQATRSFLGQFRGRSLSTRLGVGREIAGIAGSTLTSHAITATVRRVLAIHEVLASAPPREPTP